MGTALAAIVWIGLIGFLGWFAFAIIFWIVTGVMDLFGGGSGGSWNDY